MLELVARDVVWYHARVCWFGARQKQPFCLRAQNILCISLRNQDFTCLPGQTRCENTAGLVGIMSCICSIISTSPRCCLFGVSWHGAVATGAGATCERWLVRDHWVPLFGWCGELTSHQRTRDVGEMLLACMMTTSLVLLPRILWRVFCVCTGVCCPSAGCVCYDEPQEGTLARMCVGAVMGYHWWGHSTRHWWCGCFHAHSRRLSCDATVVKKRSNSSEKAITVSQSVVLVTAAQHWSGLVHDGAHFSVSLLGTRSVLKKMHALQCLMHLSAGLLHRTAHVSATCDRQLLDHWCTRCMLVVCPARCNTLTRLLA